MSDKKATKLKSTKTTEAKPATKKPTIQSLQDEIKGLKDALEFAEQEVEKLQQNLKGARDHLLQVINENDNLVQALDLLKTAAQENAKAAEGWFTKLLKKIGLK